MREGLIDHLCLKEGSDSFNLSPSRSHTQTSPAHVLPVHTRTHHTGSLTQGGRQQLVALSCVYPVKISRVTRRADTSYLHQCDPLNASLLVRRVFASVYLSKRFVGQALPLLAQLSCSYRSMQPCRPGAMPDR